MPRVHVLERSQRIERPPAEVFAFYADAGNLERITPPWLGFEVTTAQPIEMRVGATVLGDRVRYAIPLGPLGEAARALFVERDLERIFDYRREAVAALLGEAEPPRP